MYYPIQIPYILSKEFNEYIEYKEVTIEELKGFVICYWQMLSIKSDNIQLENIIIQDGCIDLVVDFKDKLIGFSGMSKTNFHFPIELPTSSMGFRFMPGAFYQITKRNSLAVMDTFLPILEVYKDFNINYFFSLSFDEARNYLIDFIKEKIRDITPNSYTKLFNKLMQNPPTSVSELCQILNISQSQCQRKFNKNYGLSPKTVLSILRFQKSISILTNAKSNSKDILKSVQYYDQSHFINDFKQNIGLTPLELLSRYKND